MIRTKTFVASLCLGVKYRLKRRALLPKRIYAHETIRQLCELYDLSFPNNLEILYLTNRN